MKLGVAREVGDESWGSEGRYDQNALREILRELIKAFCRDVKTKIIILVF